MTPLFANILQPLINVADAILTFFHDSLGFSWGAAIIGMTIVVRLCILPLTYKQVRSMQAMQRLQPEIKKLQERYKDDKQRMNQEMMTFYKENKVNPLGSCLPIVLQIPFFMSLFWLLRGPGFRADIAGEQSFLFIPDLAAKGSGVVLVTLITLYVLTQLGASLVTAISADRNQRLLVLGMPFLFVFFVFQFPTGLLVYWITTNVWTIGQQLFVRKFLPPPEPVVAAVDNGSNGKAKRTAGADGEDEKPSLFERLAGMAESAQKSAAASPAGPKGDEARPLGANGGSSAGGREPAKTGAAVSHAPRNGDGAPANGSEGPRTPPNRRKKKRSGRRR